MAGKAWRWRQRCHSTPLHLRRTPSSRAGATNDLLTDQGTEGGCAARLNGFPSPVRFLLIVVALLPVPRPPKQITAVSVLSRNAAWARVSGTYPVARLHRFPISSSSSYIPHIHARSFHSVSPVSESLTGRQDARLTSRAQCLKHPGVDLVLSCRAPAAWVSIHRTSRQLDRLWREGCRLLPLPATFRVHPCASSPDNDQADHDPSRPSPTHIAFSATSTLQVRECYAAALNAGGIPSGAPSHRNNDCGCFNAAVEDLDGNTIEFILREPCEAEHQQAIPAPSEHSRVLDWQEDVARSGADDVQSATSRVSKAKSRAQTALDLASTTSKSMRSSSQAPTPSITRTRTEPIGPSYDNGGKAIVGTLLGAAAGAAFAYAMCQSERDNARDEASFAASTRSRPLARSMSAREGRSQSNYEGKSTVSKRSHRNFSTTESRVSSRYPPRSMPRTMQRMLQPTAFNEDDNEVQDVISRYTQSRRPAPSRSQTCDAIDYQPSVKSHVSGRSNGYGLQRASTLPVDNAYLLEAPKTAPASHHTSRRGSFEDDKLQRHDSVVSARSRHSEARRSSASTAKPSRRERDSHYDSASKAGSARPSTHRDRDRESHYDSASKASTAKPSRRGSTYDSAAHVPIPPSRSHSYYSAAERPLPPSRSASHVSAAQVPAPASRAGSRYTAAPQDPGANALSDHETVVPEDSISCVDFSAPRREKAGSSRHGGAGGSQRSEASTVKPAKRSGGSRHSAATMPVRSREEAYGKEHKGGKRSLLSFA